LFDIQNFKYIWLILEFKGLRLRSDLIYTYSIDYFTSYV
jgi:hypothetical protein